MTIKILLVEDQKLIRIGIKSLFNDYPEFEIIGEASCGKEAVEKSKLIKPDIVLMDLGLPDINGIEATKQILEHNNNIKVKEDSAYYWNDKHFFVCKKAGRRACICETVFRGCK